MKQFEETLNRLEKNFDQLSEEQAMRKAEQALYVVAAGAVLLLGELVYLVYNAL